MLSSVPYWQHAGTAESRPSLIGALVMDGTAAENRAVCRVCRGPAFQDW